MPRNLIMKRKSTLSREEVVMEFLVIWILCIVISTVVHAGRGRGVEGFLFAFFLGIIGFALAFALKEKVNE